MHIEELDTDFQRTTVSCPMVMKPTVLGEAPSVGKWHCSQKHTNQVYIWLRKQESKIRIIASFYLSRKSQWFVAWKHHTLYQRNKSKKYNVPQREIPECALNLGYAKCWIWKDYRVASDYKGETEAKRDHLSKVTEFVISVEWPPTCLLVHMQPLIDAKCMFNYEIKTVCFFLIGWVDKTEFFCGSIPSCLY